MSNHDKLKRDLELAAINLFIPLYCELTGEDYELQCIQESPDIILQDSHGKILGVEITHLFYDAVEAKMLLNRTNRTMHGLESFDNLIKELNDLLEKKRIKGLNYQIDFPCSLLIRNSSPIFGLSDFKNAIINVPHGIYKDIWLLSRDVSSSWHILRLG